MKHLNHFSKIFIILMASLWVLKSQAEIIYVNQSAIGNDDGTSWADAFVDLQDALISASAGDSVWVAAATYIPTSSTDRQISFTIPDSVAVYGGFNGTESAIDERIITTNITTLSGDIGVIGDSTDNSYHVVKFVSVSNQTILDGFVISGGKSDNYDENDPITDIIAGGGLLNAVYSIGDSSNPIIANCSFINNYAFIGGGLCNYTKFGKTSPTISNCFFSGNNGFYGAGLNNFVFDHGICTAVIDSCTFSANNAHGEGGGASNLGIGGECNPIFTNCTFTLNHAVSGSGGLANSANNHFGQFASLDVKMDHCTFTNNLTNSSGGGVGNYCGTDCTLKNAINHCTFDYNKSINDTNYTNGGGLSVGCDSAGYVSMNLKNCTFSHDSAYSNIDTLWSNGGGISIYSNAYGTIDADFDSCTFNANYVSHAGGGLGYDCQSNAIVNVNLTGCWFTNNTAGKEGGALKTSSNGNGENILNAKNCTFDGNVSNEQGGGIFASCNNSVINHLYDNCFIQNNVSKQQGGGIYNACWDTTGKYIPQYTDCTFENNASDSSNGGAMYNYFSDARFTNCTFNNNNAYNSGGALGNNNSHAIIESCTITNNHALNEHAGGINNWKSNPVIKNSTIEHNSALHMGGGMFNNSSNAKIIHSTIQNNTADNGGGIANFSNVFNMDSMIIRHCFIINNEAFNNGGGVYNVTSGMNCNPEFINCVMYGDTAVSGGAVFNQAQTDDTCSPVFINTTITGNRTDNTGGAIANYTISGTCQPSFINSIIFGNHSPGGAITNINAIPVYSYSDIEGSGGSTSWNTAYGTDYGNNIDTDPLMIDMPDYNQAPNATGNLVLQASSPCIDTGMADTTGLGLPPLDIAGNARIINDRIDMGAYELDNIPPGITCPGNQAIDANQPNDTYLVTGGEFDPVITGENGEYTLTNDFNGKETLDSAEIPLGSHTIKWIVEDMSGNKDSCTFDVNVSGFVNIENSQVLNVSIYPNPTDGNIYIQGISNGTIEIFDITGTLTYTTLITGEGIEIDLSSLHNGLYFIKITTESNTITKKVIKK